MGRGIVFGSCELLLFYYGHKGLKRCNGSFQKDMHFRMCMGNRTARMNFNVSLIIREIYLSTIHACGITGKIGLLIFFA